MKRDRESTGALRRQCTHLKETVIKSYNVILQKSLNVPHHMTADFATIVIVQGKFFLGNDISLVFVINGV